MIEFSKITKTVTGIDCKYLGPREYRGKILHRFAMFNDQGEVFCFYDDKGTKLDFDGVNWITADCSLHQIIAPPKIVEVTRWIGYYWDKDKGDVCTDLYFQIYPDAERAYLKLLKITESIEVPNE